MALRVFSAFRAPRRIQAYDSKNFWPPSWDRAVMTRLMVDQHACRIIDELWDTRDHLGQVLLEACLEMRCKFEDAPKIAPGVRDAQVNRVAACAWQLIELVKANPDALRTQHPLPLTVECLFPERYAAHSWTSEYEPLHLVEILQKVAQAMEKKQPALLTARPGHQTALRTYTAQTLMRLFLYHGDPATEDPRYSAAAVLTNLVVGDPALDIDTTHIAKLDQGRL